MFPLFVWYDKVGRMVPTVRSLLTTPQAGNGKLLVGG